LELLRTLSSKHELLCWLIGGVAAIELFDYSNAFKLTAATCYYGFALLSVVAFLFWLKLRKRPSPQPMWLRILANFVLVIVTATFLLYIVGVATW
jgi:hypothetical protein